MGPLAFNVNRGYFKSAGRSLNIGRREIKKKIKWKLDPANG